MANSINILTLVPFNGIELMVQTAPSRVSGRWGEFCDYPSASGPSNILRGVGCVFLKIL